MTRSYIRDTGDFLSKIQGLELASNDWIFSMDVTSNSFHQTIKFTVEYSKKSITFLAVTTYQEDNRIKATLFVKPIDSHSYLDFSSCHPQSIKSSSSLRGYPPNLTIPALHRCNNISQREALLPKEKNDSDDDSLFCITEFNPLYPPISEWIHESFTGAQVPKC